MSEALGRVPRVLVGLFPLGGVTRYDQAVLLLPPFRRFAYVYTARRVQLPPR
jgi:hypothetical protein